MTRQRHGFLQANLNHSTRAQDLFVQAMVEWNVGIAVACEPYYVPPNSNWSGDINGSVAVVVGSSPGPPLSTLETGPGLVVARWGKNVVVGAYFSPNRSLAEFEAFLSPPQLPWEGFCPTSEGRRLLAAGFTLAW